MTSLLWYPIFNLVWTSWVGALCFSSSITGKICPLRFAKNSIFQDKIFRLAYMTNTTSHPNKWAENGWHVCAENDQTIPHPCLDFVTILSVLFCRAILVIPLFLFGAQNIMKCSLEAKTSFCDFFASPRWQYAVIPNCMILTRLQISFARLTRISQKKPLFPLHF